MSVFRKSQRVRHKKTGNWYKILKTPDHRRLEHNGEYFYEYRSLTQGYGHVWIRCKSEMEDGRFE